MPDYLLTVIQFHHSADYSLHRTQEGRQLKAILQLAELFYQREANPGQVDLAVSEAHHSLLQVIAEQLSVDLGHDLTSLENRVQPLLEKIRAE